MKTIFTNIFVLLYLGLCSGLTPECADDWSRFQSSIGSELWATRMEDATGKRESGILENNFIFEGRYKECANVRENETDPDAIQGLYCLAVWPGPTLGDATSRGFGYCIPHSCNDDDARILLEEVHLPLWPPSENNTEIRCVRDKDMWSDPAAITSIVIISVFGVIVIVATLFDVVISIQKDSIRNTKIGEDDKLSGHLNEGAELQNLNGHVKQDDCDNTNPNLNRQTSNGEIIMNGKTIVKSVDALPVKKFVQPEGVGNDMPEQVKSTHIIIQPQQGAKDKITEQPSTMVRVLLSFSLYTNVPRLLSAKPSPGSVRCLHGLRFLSMAWIVCGHTYQHGFFINSTFTVSNMLELLSEMTKLRHMAVNEMWLAVETFFIMSAMLVTISFMKTVKRQGDRVTFRQMVLYYFHRYWRLTPVYAVILMIWTNLFYYFGAGPFYKEPNFDSCKSLWWINLLYIQNLSSDWVSCMGWSWYLANDFQFYVMAPAFIAIACFYPKLGVVAMVAGYSGSLTANIVLYHKFHTGTLEDVHFNAIYMRPWTRSSTYFIGLILGFIIFQTKNKSLKLHKGLVLCGWFVSLSLIFLSVYGQYMDNCSADSPVCDPWTVAGKVTFASLQTTIFSLGVSWIIFACIHGYGGIINIILSWNFWLPLSRLTYTGYLIHPILMYYFMYSSPVQLYMYNWLMIYLFLGHLILTLGISSVITLVFEIPMLGIEKVLIPSKK